MPFRFRYLCDLLQSLDDNRVNKRVTGPRAKNSDIPIIISWFNKYDSQISRHGSAAVAFLSCLFPERRADRVYNVQEKRLEKIVGRSLFLSTTRLTHLSSWRTANGADFAQTVENVMSEAENPRPRPEHEATLDEIDALFDRIAASYSGSSPELQTRILDPIAASEALDPLFRRLQSNEAKWLIRMFLKRYTSIELPERLTMRQFHCLLPDILCLQNCFRAAIKCLDDPAVSHLCPRPRIGEREREVRLEAAPHLKPQVGVMLQRSAYYKARSIQHCCDMAARRRISVERKYDGEYCQVHIDISKGNKCIKIFSKSGKDSTDDRVRLHGAIENGLKLGKKDCPIKKKCILEGELLVWHEKKQQIQPFEKIRKNVTRNGRFLGNDQDSPRDLHEKVMIMFYDLLLYDDIVCLHESVEQRRSRLHSLVRRVPGQAELGYREKINFASPDAKSLMRLAFAKCISRGWKGFVLKGCDDPYFSLAGSSPCIKLKKDYITGLGDMADLAVIGGRRDARHEQALNIGRLSWTTFHLGCLENRDEVRRFSAKPRFRIVGVVSAAKTTISPDRTRLFNQLGQFERTPYASNRAEMEVIMDQRLDTPTELFKNPFVVEVVGGGFEKPANVAYHSLRFPRITRIHEDRSWHDVMSFDELQGLADKAQAIAANEDSQEDCEWIQKLIHTDPRSNFVVGNSTSTSTARRTGSVTTASGTPSAHLSPLLVRIDTQEMTVQERCDRALSAGSNYPSIALPTEVTNPPKRKRSVHDYGPTANTSTKRFRLSPQHTGTDVDSASCDRKPGLPSSDPQPRRRLLEIQDRSIAPSMPTLESQPAAGQRSARSQHNSQRGSSPSSKEIRSPAVTLLLRGKIATVRPASLVERGVFREGTLLTPRTSSAEEGQAGRAQSAPHGQRRRSHAALLKEEERHPSHTLTGPHAPLRNKVHRESARSTSVFQRCASMIFLSRAIKTRVLSDRPKLLSSFANVEASFTFSYGVFLDNLQKASNLTHIAIVDIADADDTGKEVGAFYRSISAQLRDGLLVVEGCLVFFNWKILQLLSSNELSLQGPKPYFGACLAWKNGSAAVRKRSWEVRDIWEWEEVMNLMQ